MQREDWDLDGEGDEEGQGAEPERGGVIGDAVSGG